MPTRSRALLLLGLVAALIGLVLFLNRQNPSDGTDDSLSKQGAATDNTTSEPATHGISAQTKTRLRSPKEEPDFGKTLATLRTVIPGLTEFPEQTLGDRIRDTNALLKKHDIALRFGIDEILYPSNHLLDLRLPAFSRQNASPRDILRHDVSAMDKHYFISGDKVLYQDGSGG